MHEPFQEGKEEIAFIELEVQTMLSKGAIRRLTPDRLFLICSLSLRRQAI